MLTAPRTVSFARRASSIGGGFHAEAMDYRTVGSSVAPTGGKRINVCPEREGAPLIPTSPTVLSASLTQSRDLIPWSVQQTALDGSFDSPTLMPQFQRGGLQELVLDSTQQRVWNGSALAPVATPKCTDTHHCLEYKGAMRTTVGASVMSPVTSLVTAYRGVVEATQRGCRCVVLDSRVAQRFRLAWIHANASHQAKKSHFQLPHCHTPIPVQVWPSTCSPCRTTFLSFTTMLPALRSRAARWDEP